MLTPIDNCEIPFPRRWVFVCKSLMESVSGIGSTSKKQKTSRVKKEIKRDGKTLNPNP
jgi:hypothetical protein